MGESHTSRGQGVDVGRFMKPAGVTSQFVGSQVVDQEDNDIRPTRLLCQGVCRKGGNREKQGSNQANVMCVSHDEIGNR